MRCKSALKVFIFLILCGVLYCAYVYLADNLTSEGCWWLDHHHVFAAHRIVSKSGFESNTEEIMKDKDDYANSPTISVVQNHYKKRKKFFISKPFHFPQPRFSKSTVDLLHSSWILALQDYLGEVEGKQVSLVTSSIEHTDVLLNWLIAAHLIANPPLHSVLILTLDLELKDLLKKRGFSVLFVNPDWVINPKAQVTRVFSKVHIVRLAVIRLMNNYGFDVVNYDCDAITLKNPQEIFDSHKDTDLIGTFGKGPGYYFKKWGVTLNTGVMLLRANSRIGKLIKHKA